MKQRLVGSALAFVAGPLLGACTSEDVYIAPYGVTADERLVACGLATLSNPCDPASFPDLDVSTRTSARTLAYDVGEMRSTASGSLRTLEFGCRRIVEAARGTVLPIPGAVETKDVRVLCEEALAALARIERGAVVVRITQGACRSTPPPACAARDAAPSVLCAQDSVTVAVTGRVKLDDLELADSLKVALPYLLPSKGMVDAFATHVGQVVRNLSALPAPCGSAFDDATVRANADLTTVVELSGRFVTVLGATQ